MGGADSPDLKCCRVIFGEADGFPGLTVDRFSEILVTPRPFHWALNSERILSSRCWSKSCGKTARISARSMNGMMLPSASWKEWKREKGFYPLAGETVPDYYETTITENGVQYLVDFKEGQKTGFFLDQKYNRLAVARLAKGKRVLDCFTHTGSFAFECSDGRC